MSGSRGFSLLESIAVIGIIALIATIIMTTSRDSRNKAMLRDAHANAIQTIEKARSRAITGYGTDDHGVYIELNKITLFEGATFPGSGKETKIPPFIDMTTDSNPVTEIVFTRLVGTASDMTTITLTHSSGISSEIKITINGTIDSQ
ncbi:type II secretion system protein [Patescibacteria group bacterium]